MLKIVLNDSMGAIAQWIQFFYYNMILFGFKKNWNQTEYQKQLIYISILILVYLISST